jgi:hypothetical protein
MIKTEVQPIAKAIWAIMCKEYKCRTRFATRHFPDIVVTESHTYKSKGLTYFQNEARGRIRPFIKIRLGTDFQEHEATLVHELFHARGYRHGIIKGERFKHNLDRDVASRKFVERYREVIRPTKA